MRGQPELCGFAGFLNLTRTSAFDSKILSRMGEALYHRGPDAGDIWFNESLGIGLVHRRLSIVDLSSSGNQPMHSFSGRLVIAFNGEVYNYVQLRKAVDEHAFSRGVNILWRGKSDTEVLINAIEVFGLEEALNKTTGMFAFALWDSVEQTLTLARDRCGEKPLLFAKKNGLVVFGSELQAILCHPSVKLEVSPKGLASYLNYGFLGGGLSIAEGIVRVPTASFVEFKKDGSVLQKEYWSRGGLFLESKDVPETTAKGSSYFDGLEKHLSHAVQSQLMGDAPLGCFLSGGTDSSLVSAIAQRDQRSPLDAFTIGFDDPRWDESEVAQRVARQLGMNHHVKILSGTDLLNSVDKLTGTFDEPFSDPSQLPTLLLTGFAGESVKVCISGDGADELFAGYSRYSQIQALQRVHRILPNLLRRLITEGSTRLLSGYLSLSLNSKIGRVPLQKLNKYFSPDKALKATELLSGEGFFDTYEQLLRVWNASSVIRGESEFKPGPWGLSKEMGENALLAMTMYDFKNYLPDDILVKVDRTSMRNSLEVRAPFLDHNLIKFLDDRSLPEKVQMLRIGKAHLREMLRRYISDDLIYRPKKGFGVPLASWLRHELKDWAFSYLNPAVIRGQGFFDEKEVARIWRQHQSGGRDWHRKIWTLLMFQVWYNRFNQLN